MTRFHRLHTCALVLQVVAFLFSFVVGICLVVKSNFLVAAQAVIAAIRDDGRLGEKSELKSRDDDQEDALETVRLVAAVVGALALASSVLIFFNTVCLLALMCGPESAFVRYCLCMSDLRDHLEEEIKAMEADRMPAEGRGGAREDLTRREATIMKRRESRSPFNKWEYGSTTTASTPVDVGRSRRRRSSVASEKRGRRRKRAADPERDRSRYDSGLREKPHTKSKGRGEGELPKTPAPSYAPQEDRGSRELAENTKELSSLKPVDSDSSSAKERRRRGHKKRPMSPASGHPAQKHDRKALRSVKVSPAAPPSPRATSSSPSASPDRDRRRYKNALKAIKVSPGRSPRTTSSSPSASPDKDLRRYEERLRDTYVKVKKKGRKSSSGVSSGGKKKSASSDVGRHSGQGTGTAARSSSSSSISSDMGRHRGETFPPLANSGAMQGGRLSVARSRRVLSSLRTTVHSIGDKKKLSKGGDL